MTMSALQGLCATCGLEFNEEFTPHGKTQSALSKISACANAILTLVSMKNTLRDYVNIIREFDQFIRSPIMRGNSDDNAEKGGQTAVSDKSGNTEKELTPLEAAEQNMFGLEEPILFAAHCLDLTVDALRTEMLSTGIVYDLLSRKLD